MLCGGGGGPEHDPLSRGTLLLGLLAVVVVVEVAEVGEGGRAGADLVGRVGGRALRAERLDGVIVVLALQRLLVLVRGRGRRLAYRRGVGIVSLALILRSLF